MNRRTELLQTLLDLITHSMLEYTTKVEDDESINYSINRKFAENYIKETSDISFSYVLYQLTVERLCFPQNLNNLWEIQKEVLKGKARQIDVIRKMQEMTETYMSEYRALAKTLYCAPPHILPVSLYTQVENNAVEMADVIVYLRDQLKEFLENSQNTWYKISFKK